MVYLAVTASVALSVLLTIAVLGLLRRRELINLRLERPPGDAPPRSPEGAGPDTTGGPILETGMGADDAVVWLQALTQPTRSMNMPRLTALEPGRLFYGRHTSGGVIVCAVRGRRAISVDGVRVAVSARSGRGVLHVRYLRLGHLIAAGLFVVGELHFNFGFPGTHHPAWGFSNLVGVLLPGLVGGGFLASGLRVRRAVIHELRQAI
jgi:hypothetical protein